jgi:hypothetical protein
VHLSGERAHPLFSFFQKNLLVETASERRRIQRFGIDSGEHIVGVSNMV